MPPITRSSVSNQVNIQSQPNRKQIMAQRLAEVNGIVIASKVPPGQTPDKGTGKEDSRARWTCSICGRHCSEKNNVKHHMPACVKKNGNPLGAHWDDAWADEEGHT